MPLTPAHSGFAKFRQLHKFNEKQSESICVVILYFREDAPRYDAGLTGDSTLSI